jgi:hypothetical protein
MTDNGYGISEGNDKNAMESVIWWWPHNFMNILRRNFMACELYLNLKKNRGVATSYQYVS